MGRQTERVKEIIGNPERITTPAGIVRYAWLQNPDTRFNPEGVYKVDLLIPSRSCIDLRHQLDDLVVGAFSSAKAAAKNPRHAKQITVSRPYFSDCDKVGEDAEQMEIRFRMIAKIKTSVGDYIRRPFVFDAYCNAVEKCPEVGRGSRLKINFTPLPYFNPATREAGVSLRLNAVQILELVARNGESATEFGFTSGEGSFVANKHDARAVEPGVRYQNFPTRGRRGRVYVSSEAMKAWVESREVKRCPTCGVAFHR